MNIKPFTKLMRKNKPERWEGEQKKPFKEIKKVYRGTNLKNRLTSTTNKG